jgi:protoporphyrinogen oxidase
VIFSDAAEWERAWYIISPRIQVDSQMTENKHLERVAILGAGISGLASAALLKEGGYDVRLLEASSEVGGLARSFDWHGFHCDIAPHRLFTRDKEAKERLLELVPMHRHQRRSRIFIAGHNVRDPVSPLELMLRLSPRVSSRLVWGYLFKPNLPETSFENLALNKFGRGLYEFFFKPYTTKMFGVSPAEISVSWGRQKLRVSGLKDVIRRNTKIFFREFHYPKYGGYGAICHALAHRVADEISMNSRVVGVDADADRLKAIRYEKDGREERFECDRVVSTLPATMLGKMLGHDFDLRFQSVVLVYLLVEKPQVMPYHWVYFGDSDVVINRMSEFKNFAHADTPEDRTALVAEVTIPSDDPLEDVLKALERYGLVAREQVLDSMLLHERYAYPVYDQAYEKAIVESQRVFGRYENLHLVGRNAEFRHIEVDEAFASALAMVRSLDDSKTL